MQRLLFATMIALMMCGTAPAEEGSSPPSAAPPATAESVDSSVAGKGEPEVAPERLTSKHGSRSSTEEYKRLLAAEVRRRTFDRDFLIAGSADVVFTIGASGRVVDYSLRSMTEGRKVESAVRLIMAAIRIPPPPGGSFEAQQEIRFSSTRIVGPPAGPGAATPRIAPSFDTWKDYRFSGESPSRQRNAYLVMMSGAMEKRRTTALTPHGVLAVYHVNGSGRVDKVKIARASSPEQAQIAHKLLYGLQAPPPPGGALTITTCFAAERDQEKRARSPRAFCHAFKPGAN